MQAHTLAVGRETSILYLIQLVPIVKNRQIVLQFPVTIRGHQGHIDIPVGQYETIAL